MHLERKLSAIALGVTAVAASIAIAQISPARRSDTGGQPSRQIAQLGAFDSLKMTPMQEVLMDLISWKQSVMLASMGGHPTVDYSSLSQSMIDARMEIVRACNLYHRATLTKAQQEEFDRTILDPKGHPLPPKWQKMLSQGTLVSSLLKSDARQQAKATQVLEAFRERNRKIWGHGNDGGYAKNLGLLVKEFSAILTKEQGAEFGKLWASYVADVEATKRNSAINP